MTYDTFGGMIFGAGHNGESCHINVTASGLELLLNGNAAGRITWNAVKISVAGTDDRYLRFDSTVAGEELSVWTGNKAIVDAIRTTGAPMPVLQLLDNLGAIRKRRAMGRWSILGIFAGIIVFLVMGALLGVRVAVSTAIEHIPLDWEKELGRTEAVNILSANKTCIDPQLNAAVQEIGRRLVMGMGSTPYQWQIKVIDVPDVNAFALPGGYVFINRGLIEAADSSDELAGVLAHEFQHVLGRHGMRNVLNNLGLQLLVLMVMGDTGAVERYLINNVAQLAAMQYSRKQESKADMGAIDLAYKSKFDPYGFLTFMTKLEEKEEAQGTVVTIVSTHPGSAERMADIKEKIAALGKPTIAPFKADWATIKTKCGPANVTTPDELAQQ